MSVTTNYRLFYALYALGITTDGSTSFIAAHGVQSCGVTTRFNLDHVFELGQLNEYQAVENVPDIEITAEKTSDGYPWLYHLATQLGSDASLLGRSNVKCIASVAYVNQAQSSVSGVPIHQMTASGLFPSSLTYTFPVNGNITESITLVGNDKQWLSSNYTFTGGFLNNDVPPSGIKRRQNVVMGSTVGISSIWPGDIPGLVSGLYNDYSTVGILGTHFQSARISTNLGRTPLYELGHKAPYFRASDFPIEVRSDFEIMDLQGDGVVANTESNNITAREIVIYVDEGSKFDLGTLNRLTSVTESGGNAGVGGGNRTITFSYTNFNNMKLTAPHDPGSLA